MTKEERILNYLRWIAPGATSNSEIGRSTEIRPHQQVFQITQRLLDGGMVKGARDGREWRFWIEAGRRRRTQCGHYRRRPKEERRRLFIHSSYPATASGCRSNGSSGMADYGTASSSFFLKLDGKLEQLH